MNIKFGCKIDNKIIKTGLYSVLGLSGLLKVIKDAGQSGLIWSFLSLLVIGLVIGAEY